MLSQKKKNFAKKLANIMTEFMQKTENSYLWPSRFESNPQSYGSKGARNFADVAHCVKGTMQMAFQYSIHFSGQKGSE